MTPEERIQQQNELVEKIGRFYDKASLQPIASRILGMLIIMDKEHYTFDEIVKELQISKSSASNALQVLEIKGLIEYNTFTGDRKRYFQLKRHDKFVLIDEHREKLKQTIDFFQAAYDLKAIKNSANAVFLENMIHITNFFIEKLEELKKDYLEKK